MTLVSNSLIINGRIIARLIIDLDALSDSFARVMNATQTITEQHTLKIHHKICNLRLKSNTYKPCLRIGKAVGVM